MKRNVGPLALAIARDIAHHVMHLQVAAKSSQGVMLRIIPFSTQSWIITRCAMRNSQVAEDVLANSLEDRLIHEAPQRDVAVLWLTATIICS